MSRVEIGYAVLAITGTAWARIHHWLADRRIDAEEPP